MISRDTITATILDGAGVDLGRVSGRVTMDEGWAPHVQATLTIPLPDAATLDLLDTRALRRVSITMAQVFPASFIPAESRTFNLGIRDRSVDWPAGTVTLDLASDEARLQEDLLMASTPLYTLAEGPTLRSVVNAVLARHGAVLEAGTADQALAPHGVNCILNPTAAVDLSNVTAAVNLALTRQTTITEGSHGTGFRLTPGANSDNYISIALSEPLLAGKTYTVRGVFRVGSVALAGTVNSRARRIVIISNPGGVNQVTHQSAQATNTADTSTTLTLTFTLAADVTAAELRFYLGHTSNVAYWYDLRMSPGTTDTLYLDGDSTDPAYTFTWLGPVGLSKSIRVLAPRSASAMVWSPSVSAWDFLQPLFQAAGFRLFCDEARKWYLVDGSVFVAAGVTQLSYGVQLEEARDEISRSSDEWFDSAIVTYRWKDAAGVDRTAIDVYAPVGTNKPRAFTVDRPYPGPGFAAYAVKRATGKGRTLALAAKSRFGVRPSQVLRAELPDTPTQLGVVGSVSWDLDTATMSVASRGLTDVPPGAWALVDPAMTWAAAPATRTWANWTNPNGV